MLKSSERPDRSGFVEALARPLVTSLTRSADSGVLKSFSSSLAAEHGVIGKLQSVHEETKTASGQQGMTRIRHIKTSV